MVLVILAILAAILVPALLGYIDKAREKKITTNAEAALVASQSIMTEQYGLGASASTAKKAAQKWSKINQLAEIKYTGSKEPTCTIVATAGSSDVTDGKHKDYVIKTYKYTENGKTYQWSSSTGEWTLQ